MKPAYIFMVFAAGFVFGLNLASMYPNPSYGSWWTAVAAVMFALVFGILSYQETDQWKH